MLRRRFGADWRRTRPVLQASRLPLGGVRAIAVAREAAFGLGAGRYEAPQAHQVVRGARDGDDPIDSCGAPMLHFPQSGEVSWPAEHLLDYFARALADRVDLLARGAPIDGAALRPLRHVRREVGCAGALHEVPRTVALVGAHGRAQREAGNASQETQRIVHFGSPIQTAHHGAHHQTVAIVDQRARLVREDRRDVERFAGPGRLWIHHGLTGRVAPLLAMNTHAVIARIYRSIRVIVLRSYTR